MEKIRFGIIGYGVQGKFYSAILTGAELPGIGRIPQPEGCVLSAVSVRRKEALAQLQQIPGVSYFADWKEMIDSRCCDAIVITTPHYSHREIAVYALEHGIHVLCDKPAAVQASEVEKMLAAAQANPATALALIHNQRTAEVFRKVKELIASGELGQLRRSSWIVNNWWRPDSYYESSSWRGTWAGEGGGVLVNQAPHQLDLWLWLCGKPKKIFAKCIEGAHRKITVENDVTILAEYENGATGTFITCTHDPMGTDRLELDFSKGKIVVENSKDATVCRFRQEEQTWNKSLSYPQLAMLAMTQPEQLFKVEKFSGAPQYGIGHGKIFENFADHLLRGVPLIATGEDGLAAVQLANAAQLSGWKHQELDFPCDADAYDQFLQQRILEENVSVLLK